MEKIIINGENAVLGRLASYAAKQALSGKNIIIVNSEKAIIVGNEKNIVARYRKKRGRGGSSSIAKPHYPSAPERILKRAIRNMLPYKKGKGREALKRVKCFINMPKEFEDKKIIKAGRGRKGISLDKISRMLRGK